jgi:hypothetical protein
LSKISRSQHAFTPIDRAALPDDVEALKEMVCTLQDTVLTLMERINRLEEKYLKLARLHFGQQSEKLSMVKQSATIPFDSLADDTVADKGSETPSQPDTDLKKKRKK